MRALILHKLFVKFACPLLFPWSRRQKARMFKGMQGFKIIPGFLLPEFWFFGCILLPLGISSTVGDEVFHVTQRPCSTNGETKWVLKFKILNTFLTSPSPRFSESESTLAYWNYAETTEKWEKVVIWNVIWTQICKLITLSWDVKLWIGSLLFLSVVCVAFFEFVHEINEKYAFSRMLEERRWHLVIMYVLQKSTISICNRLQTPHL